MAQEYSSWDYSHRRGNTLNNRRPIPKRPFDVRDRKRNASQAPGAGSALHAALRAQDDRCEIWRSRHGQCRARQGFCRRYRAFEAIRRQPDRRAWRRPADWCDADQDGHREPLRRWASRHRPEDGRDRRNGSGRLDQQGDRGAHQPDRRMGNRPVRQGRQHGLRRKGQEDHDRPGFEHREDPRSRLRRRSGRGRSYAARPARQVGDDPGHRPGRTGPRREHLQYQRRHLCRRDCRCAQCLAPALPH